MFLFGDSLKMSKEELIQQVDQKVIEYRIVEAYKSRLQDQFDLIVQGEAIAQKIETAVKQVADRELSERVGPLIAEQVAKQTKKIGGAELEQLLRIVSDATNKRGPPEKEITWKNQL